MTTISNIRAREVLDSRGNPTVEVDIGLSDGALRMPKTMCAGCW